MCLHTLCIYGYVQMCGRLFLEKKGQEGQLDRPRLHLLINTKG